MNRNFDFHKNLKYAKEYKEKNCDNMWEFNITFGKVGECEEGLAYVTYSPNPDSSAYSKMHTHSQPVLVDQDSEKFHKEFEKAVKHIKSVKWKANLL